VKLGPSYYVLTADNFLKMSLIFTRVRTGMAVVIIMMMIGVRDWWLWESMFKKR